MTDSNYTDFTSAHLSERDFCRLSDFIQGRYGIKMPPTKKSMLEGRLRKRLRQLRMSSYGQYCDYLFSSEGMERELNHFVSRVTTNKTDFFREPKHFSFLVEKVLPEMITTRGAGIERPLKVWSAACSRGHEPYTLCIVLSEFASRYPGFNFEFSILATDISTEVLEVAKKGIYSHEEIDPVPIELRKKYLLKGKDAKRSMVRVVPELRSKVKFRQLNLMENDFQFRERMDIIFCRNVIIYFDQETQNSLLKRICQYLNPGGYLFMGHSEVLHSKNLPLESVATTVYKRT